MSQNNNARETKAHIKEFIEEYYRENGIGPSLREIKNGLDLKSTCTISRYVDDLVERGKLVKSPNTARGVIPAWGNVLPIPMMGTISAGNPIQIDGDGLEAFQAEDFIEVPESYLPTNINRNEVFALRVEGNSMRDAMISDGDIVIIQRAQGASHNDIIVAWLKDKHQTTLKQIKINEKRAKLVPRNPDYNEIELKLDQLEIQGRFLAAIRIKQ